MRRLILMTIGLAILSNLANAQLIYSKCCTQSRPPLYAMVFCLSGPGAWWPHMPGGLYARISTCLLGFADNDYSNQLAAQMCLNIFDPPPVLDTDGECSEWLVRGVAPGVICEGASYAGTECQNLFDFDGDDDVDLADFQYYQIHWDQLRPLN